MIKVLEILKAPKLETLICNIDKDGRTDKIKKPQNLDEMLKIAVR